MPSRSPNWIDGEIRVCPSGSAADFYQSRLRPLPARCDSMAAARTFPMMMRTNVLNPSTGNCRELDVDVRSNRPHLSEIHLRAKSISHPSRPAAAMVHFYPMSIPSTMPGSTWAWRLKRITKKKCKSCDGECTDCPHSESGARAAAPAAPPGEPGRNGRGDLKKHWSSSPATGNGRSSAAVRTPSRRGHTKPPSV
jgi:hypothetical protein